MSLDRFQKIIVFSVDFTVCIVLQNVNIAIPSLYRYVVQNFCSGGLLRIFLFYRCYSPLLHLPFLRFKCVGGCCRDRTQDCCIFGIDSQTLQPPGGWDLAECGWDLAECIWYLAECGWDLAECGWDPEKIQKKLFSLQSIGGNFQKTFSAFLAFPLEWVVPRSAPKNHLPKNISFRRPTVLN